MEGVVRARLTTTGRRTGRPHSVTLRGVIYREHVYFSRHRPDADWFLNALANPEVAVEWDGNTVRGMASRPTDPDLERQISRLKYPGDPRGEERRVMIRVRIIR